MHKLRVLGYILLLLSIVACAGDVTPKPRGMLRLSYGDAAYEVANTGCGFSFQKNNQAILKNSLRNKHCWYNLEYPHLNATMYLSYQKVNNDLKKLLTDAQNLTREHVVKADEILDQPYEDKKNKVYGMFYEVLGDAASQSQFYVTDSTKHFLLGSVYFKVKPNYDSIYPAAIYMQNDMRRLMESLRWED